MTRRTDFQKAITYTGQKLKSPVIVSYKIDGIRVLSRDSEIVTRNNKTMVGLDISLTDAAKEKIHSKGDCEIYTGDFAETSSIVRTHEPEENCLDESCIYSLQPLDSRLIIGVYPEVSVEFIREQLKEALDKGYEGLVLRTPDAWYRVKPVFTADVYITGWFEQQDKHGVPKGQLGGFITNYGRITAFTEDLRVSLWDNPEQYVGKLCTGQYKELYSTGMFRYAVKFCGFREDKDEESFDSEPDYDNLFK